MTSIGPKMHLAQPRFGADTTAPKATTTPAAPQAEIPADKPFTFQEFLGGIADFFKDIRSRIPAAPELNIPKPSTDDLIAWPKWSDLHAPESSATDEPKYQEVLAASAKLNAETAATVQGFQDKFTAITAPAADALEGAPVTPASLTAKQGQLATLLTELTTAFPDVKNSLPKTVTSAPHPGVSYTPEYTLGLELLYAQHTVNTDLHNLVSAKPKAVAPMADEPGPADPNAPLPMPTPLEPRRAYLKLF